MTLTSFFDTFAWCTQIFSCFLSEYVVVVIIPFFPARFPFLSSQRAASLTANQTTYTRIQGHTWGPGALHPAGPSLRPARPALDAHILLWSELCIKHWFRDLNRSQRETPAQWIRFSDSGSDFEPVWCQSSSRDLDCTQGPYYLKAVPFFSLIKIQKVLQQLIKTVKIHLNVFVVTCI